MHELKYVQQIFDEIKRSKGKKNFLIKISKNHDLEEIKEMLIDMMESNGKNFKFSIEATPVKIKCENCNFIGVVDIPFSTVGFRAICPSCKKNKTKIVSKEIDVGYA